MVTLLIWRIRCVQMSLKPCMSLSRRWSAVQETGEHLCCSFIHVSKAGRLRAAMMKGRMVLFLRAQSALQIFCLMLRKMSEISMFRCTFYLPPQAVCVSLCIATQKLSNSLCRPQRQTLHLCINSAE